MSFCKIFLPDGVTELPSIKNVSFTESVNAGVDLRPGCVSSAKIEVEAFGAQSVAVSVGDALTFYTVDKNNTQTLIGTFYAEPVIATKNSYKFSAYDAANKLNADFSAWLRANQSNFPMTIYALVSAACTVAGVTLGSASWPLSTENVQAFYADGITCRDILSYAAELACKFVRCDSNGNIIFDWYATATNKRIYPLAGTSGSETRYAYKQDGLSYTNYTTATLDRVAVHPGGEDEVAYIYPTNVSGGNTLHIQNNLLLTGASASLYNSAAQTIYTAMTALGTYRPFGANLFVKENPFRAGDVVAVTDAQGVSFTTVVMAHTSSDSGATLESTGHETYEENGGNTQKAITQLASDVVRINKLKVDWAEIDAAIINYLTANNVTAQNLTIVDENDNVLATFNSNGITLGTSNEVHAEIDFNSFELYDKNGNKYFSVGDLRGANGLAHIVNTIYASGSSYYFAITPTIQDTATATVTYNGTAITTGFTLTSNGITFSTLPQAGDVIVVEYDTSSPAYHYDNGTRETGTEIGYGSVVGGLHQTASGTHSGVSAGYYNVALGASDYVGGGSNNTAKGSNCAVGGGFYNKASESAAAVCGGSYNEAEYFSFVGGGYSNKATGDSSVIGGGSSNSATGNGASVLGGRNNEASATGAVVVGGTGNQADGAYQTVFGKYNDPNNNLAEIVGNGTSDSARSNARTLDWSGNETLAGKLTLGADGTVSMDAVTLQQLQSLAAPAGYGLGESIPASSVVTDLNDVRRTGWYLYNTSTLNIPGGASGGVVLCCSMSNLSATVYQIAFPYGASPVAYIRMYSAAISAWTAWSGWFGSITESFTYSSALSGFSSSSFGGRYDPSTRTVRIRFNFAASANILTSDVLFTIPEAYRPSGTVYGSAFYQTSGGMSAYQCVLNSSGEIKQNLGNTIRSGFGYIEYVI